MYTFPNKHLLQYCSYSLSYSRQHYFLGIIFIGFPASPQWRQEYHVYYGNGNGNRRRVFNPAITLPTGVARASQRQPATKLGTRQRQVVSDTLPPTLAARRTSEHQNNIRSNSVGNAPVRLVDRLYRLAKRASVDFKEQSYFRHRFNLDHLKLQR